MKKTTKKKIPEIEDTQKWKLTQDTVNKLEQAFSLDATIEEACFYANISKQTYYNWKKVNPKIHERLDALRNKPILKARKRVVDGIEESYSNAMDYLARKKKQEFSIRTEQQIDGKTELYLTGDSSIDSFFEKQNYQPEKGEAVEVEKTIHELNREAEGNNKS